MEYIFPIPLWLRDCLLKNKRLYAFPTVPEEKPFILDSGAFGLSKSGGKMDSEYFERLYKYYQKYRCKYSVAPDVFLNPKQSMKNFQIWKDCDHRDYEVWPVIQCSSKRIEWPLIQYQLDFYTKFFVAFEILFFSNPSLRSHTYPKDIFQKIKDKYPVKWIHILGAGWDIQDIQGYANMRGLDSIDSIAWHNSTETILGNWQNIKGTRREIAIGNANYLDKIL